MFDLVKIYKDNFKRLKDELNKEAQNFEKMNYEDLLKPAESLSTTRISDNHTLSFSAESVKVLKNGEILFCIDARGLSTLFGIKPSYQFYKRKDGSVYY